MNFRIEKYQPANRDLWDRTLMRSINGSFLLQRNYMDYHSGRFRDFSLIIYTGNEPVALLPAHREGNKLYSHRGLTYGGLVLARPLRVPVLRTLWNQVLDFLARKEISGLFLDEIPLFYYRWHTEALRRTYEHSGQMISSKDFWVIDTARPKDGLCNADRRRSLRKAAKMNLQTGPSDDWQGFWDLLQNSLEKRHGAKPVHSLDEMDLLRRRFPGQILLFTTRRNDELLAGAVLYKNRHVLRFQYLAGRTETPLRPAIDALTWHIIERFYPQVRFIDLGTALLPDGSPNDTLIYWKQSFGACPHAQYSWKFAVQTYEAPGL